MSPKPPTSQTDLKKSSLDLNSSLKKKTVDKTKATVPPPEKGDTEVNDSKKVKVVKMVKTTKKNDEAKESTTPSKTKIKIQKSTLRPSKDPTKPVHKTLENDKMDWPKEDYELTRYDKEKLKRAITDRLIPIDINPLKIALTKEPPLKKDEDNQVTLSIQVEAKLKAVWELWTTPKHIKKWHTVSEDWKVVDAKVDLQAGGEFLYSMKSKNGEVSEFNGHYIDIVPYALIAYITKENLKGLVNMVEISPGVVEVSQSFEPDDINPIATQRRAWATLLENFKSYASGHK